MQYYLRGLSFYKVKHFISVAHPVWRRSIAWRVVFLLHSSVFYCWFQMTTLFRNRLLCWLSLNLKIHHNIVYTCCICSTGMQCKRSLSNVFWCVVCLTLNLPLIGNGKNPEPPTGLRLPPCASPISIWQRSDGHEERVLLCWLQTCRRLLKGEVSTCFDKNNELQNYPVKSICLRGRSFLKKHLLVDLSSMPSTHTRGTQLVILHLCISFCLYRLTVRHYFLLGMRSRIDCPKDLLIDFIFLCWRNDMD